MFAYTAPAPPFGGLAWQEVHDARGGDATGFPATWHVWQAGPTDGAEMAWQALQLPGNVADVTV
jgi:hypothetical protein